MRPGGAPEVVLVTVLDQQKYPTEYLAKVIENRKEYAEAHGTFFFFVNRLFTSINRFQKFVDFQGFFIFYIYRVWTVYTGFN